MGRREVVAALSLFVLSFFAGLHVDRLMVPPADDGAANLAPAAVASPVPRDVSATARECVCPPPAAAPSPAAAPTPPPCEPPPAAPVVADAATATACPTPTAWRRAPDLRQVGSALRLAGYNCQDKPAMVRHLRDAFVVEVGAFDGTETVALAREPGVRKVLSFEPTSAKHVTIRKNIDASGVGHKIEMRQQAVSMESGRVKFYVPERGEWWGLSAHLAALGVDLFVGVTAAVLSRRNDGGLCRGLATRLACAGRLHVHQQPQLRDGGRRSVGRGRPRARGLYQD
jgi:hypothetical protein